MANSEQRPLIQINDIIREMTDDELLAYNERITNTGPGPTAPE